MNVENKWIAGAISIPLYLVASLWLSVLGSNIIVYAVGGLVVLYLVGLCYQYLVINRVKIGVSQSAAVLQWLAIQLLVLGVWYLTTSST